MTEHRGEDQLESAEVHAVAHIAVKKVFAILGVDIDRPEQVEQFREDLRFSGKLRRAADHGVLIFVGVVVVAAAASLWGGIVDKIGGR